MQSLWGIMARWSTVLGLCAAVTLVACTERPAEVSEEPTPTPAAVDEGPSVVQVAPDVQSRLQTQVVQEQLAPRSLSAPGEVTVDLTRVAKVSSRIEGLVDQLFVHLGDRVAEGQPLVSIGSLKLDELVQNFLVSQVHVELARSNFDRVQKLHAEKIVSERQFLETRATYLQERSKNQHAREKLLNMGLSPAELKDLLEGTHTDSHRYVLRAQLNGTIVAQDIVMGEGVLPGDELFEIVDASQVWVFASLPIEDAGRFKVGDRAIIVPKGRKTIEALLAYISPIADKATLTIRIRFDVDNRDGTLKPNEYVEVKLMEEAAPVMAIPTSAVTLVEGRRGVFVRRGDGYTFSPVELGEQGDRNGWQMWPTSAATWLGGTSP